MFVAMMAISLAVVLPATGAAEAATHTTPQGRSCTAGEYTPTLGYSASFIGGTAGKPNALTYTVNNPNSTWQEEGNLTMSTSETYSTSWAGSVGATGSIDLIVVSIGGSAGVTLTKTEDKSTGSEFSSGPVDTPPHDYAHFQAGVWSESAHGQSYYLSINCIQSGTSDWSVNVPKSTDLGIDKWYNATA